MHFVEGGRARLLGGLFLGIAVSDRVTKWLASDRLTEGPFEVIPNHLDFELVHNTGIAFGLLDGLDFPGKAWLLTAFSALLLVLIGVFVFRSRPLPLLSGLGLTAMFAGAVSNMVDRLLFGHVVDFIHMYAGNAHWPTYNIADAAITSGVLLMVVDSVQELRRAPRGRAAEVAAGRAEAGG